MSTHSSLPVPLPIILTMVGILLITVACEAPTGEEDPAAAEDNTSVSLRMGAEVLAESIPNVLTGKRVGLIVNHTAQVGDDHLIDVLHEAEKIEVAALFGPEHGLRGEADAGETIEDGRDTRTGAPIFSLYGETRKPTPEMLRDVDVLVFDIQDVGARFYTYISTMGLAMEAAAEQEIPFVVLDRPNPLGGDYVSGFVLEEEHTSFVGQYPIPVAHGMTVGELAQMIKGEDWMEGMDDLLLHVEPVRGWNRSTLWMDTDLDWPRPSPNIPTDTTALVYAGTCFFEATSASEGRGTEAPFLTLGAPDINGEALSEELNALELPGVRFEPVQFTPRPMEGAQQPKLEGIDLEGIRYHITDAEWFEPVETGIHVLHAFYQHHAGEEPFIDRPAGLARLAGTERLQAMLEAGVDTDEIIVEWASEVEAFRQRRAKYLLYD